MRRLRDFTTPLVAGVVLSGATVAAAKPPLAGAAGTVSPASGVPTPAGSTATPTPGANPASAPSTASSASSQTAPPEPPPSVCVEHVPEGKERPKLTETFPSKGKSGYAVWLKIGVEHGKGETVLPGGFRLQTGSDEARGVEAAGFFIPDTAGPSAPKIATVEQNGAELTTVSIPFVALPKKPGRTELELPSLPIAIARASGDVVTVCTAPHRITLEDPIANDPNPKPKANPKPLRQVEEWILLKHATYGALVALVVAAIVAWLVRIWRRRPRVAPPPPPPRPPWEVALEALHDIRHAKLIEQARYADHFDRVSDAVRRYLGDLYGFDGLESTTREVLTKVERTALARELVAEIKVFLRKADLVKFARVTPSEAECHDALERGEQIVQKTMPSLSGPAPVAEAEPAPAPGAGGVA